MKKRKIFRNVIAQELYDRMSGDSDCDEAGVDDIGQIYFAYLNGVVDRYSRRQFIKKAQLWKELNESR